MTVGKRFFLQQDAPFALTPMKSLREVINALVRNINRSQMGFK